MSDCSLMLARKNLTQRQLKGGWLATGKSGIHQTETTRKSFMSVRTAIGTHSENGPLEFTHE
jgi:hypothetical protein